MVVTNSKASTANDSENCMQHYTSKNTRQREIETATFLICDRINFHLVTAKWRNEDTSAWLTSRHTLLTTEFFSSPRQSISWTARRPLQHKNLLYLVVHFSLRLFLTRDVIDPKANRRTNSYKSTDRQSTIQIEFSEEQMLLQPFERSSLDYGKSRSIFIVDVPSSRLGHLILLRRTHDKSVGVCLPRPSFRVVIIAVCFRMYQITLFS